jgi:hypothetical protein
MYDLESRPVSVNPFLSLLKRQVSRWFSPRKTDRRRNREGLSLQVERLEDRSLLSAGVPLDPDGLNWTPFGPSPVNQTIVPGNEPLVGRVTGIAPHPTDSNNLYIATAGGGVWQTQNALAVNPDWVPLTDSLPDFRDIFNNLVPDDQQTLVVGAIAISRSNPSVIYAGTGIGGDLAVGGVGNSVDAGGVRGDRSFGRGMLKSVDGGISWTLLPGNQATREFDFRGFSKIIVHPLNPNIVYAAVSSSVDPNFATGSYGVYKTIDGGVTWTNVTFNAPPSSSTPIPDTARFTDLVMDPVDPETLYTAVAFTGTRSGVFKTTDGGASWFRSSDFPAGNTNGVTRVAVAPTDRNIVYASISSSLPGGDLIQMMKSTNGGITWFNLPNTPNYLTNTQGGSRGFNNTTLIVDPADANIVYAGGDRQYMKTTDGGLTWINIESGPGGNTFQAHHAVAFGADGKLLDGNDGGIYRLDNPIVGSIDWDGLQGAGATGLQIALVTSIATNRTDDSILYATMQNLDSAKFTDDLEWERIASGASLTPPGGGSTDGARIVSDSSVPTTLFRTWNSDTSGTSTIERSTDSGLTWGAVGVGVVIGPTQYYEPLAMSSQGGVRRVYAGTNGVFVSIGTQGQPNSLGNTWTRISTTADCNRGADTVFQRSVPGGDEGWNTDGLITEIEPTSDGNIIWASTDDTISTVGTIPTCPATNGGGTIGGKIIPGVQFYGNNDNPGPMILVSTRQPATAGGTSARPFWINRTDELFAALAASGATVSFTSNFFNSDYIVRTIKSDPQDPNTAYVAFETITGGGQIFRTRDLGLTWDDVTGDLPKLPIYDIEIDPRQFNLPDDILYVATQNGVYTTPNIPTIIPPGGLNWKKFGNALPNSPVRDIELKKIRNLSDTNNPNDQTILVAGTYGRGVWEILANLPPTLTMVNTLGPTNEDVPITIDYNTMFSQSDIGDINGDSLTFQLDQVTSGTLTKNNLPVVAGSTRLGPGETWVWTPAPNQNNILNGNQPLNAFTVRAYDLELGSATPVQVRIDVTPVPDAPIVQTNPIQFSVAKNSTTNPFSYELITSTSGTFDPDEPPANVVTYVVQTIDLARTQSLTKGSVPVVVGVTTLSAGEILDWTPVNGFQGNVTPAFTLRVRDNTLPASLFATSDLGVNINVVNTVPVLTSTAVLTGALEDILFDIPFATLQGAADEVDANGDPISFRIVAITAGHTLLLNGNPITPGVTLFAAGDTLNYQGPLNANGQLNAFTIRAFDGNLESTPDVQVSISVTPVNDAPTLTTVNQFVTSQDFPITLSYAQLAAAANEADVDFDGLNFIIGNALAPITDPGNFSSLNVAPGTILLPGQSIVWTPPLNYTGLTSGFEIQAIDPGGLSSLPIAIVPFNVVVNNPPTMTTASTLTGAKKNLPFTITYAALATAANEVDIDVPAQALSFVIQSVSTGGLTKNGVAVTPGVTLLGTGETLVYTPVLGFQSPPTTEMFKMRVTDSFSVSIADVPVNVQIDNTAPTLTVVNTLTGAAEDTAFNIPFDTLVTAANEADADPFENVNFLISSVTNGSLLINGVPVVAGSSVLHSADTLTWTPPLNANGTIPAFTVRAFDGTALNTPQGALASTTSIQVTISVAAVNDAPTLTTINQFAGGVQGISFDFTYSALIAAGDEADVDGNTVLFRIESVTAGSTLTKNGVPVVAGLTTVGVNEKVTWTPPAGVTGPFTAFTVKAFDGLLASASPVAVSLELVTLPISRMLRAYNPNADYHFFTLSTLEFNSAVAHGYRDETTGRPGYSVATAQVNGTLAIHRLRNPYNGRHYYTTNNSELAFLTSIGWIFEKDEGFIFTTQVTGSVEVFRLWNKNTGSHLYTESAATKDAVLAMFPGIWFLHSSLGYGLPAAASGNPPASSPPTGARARLAQALSETPTANEELRGSPVGPVFGSTTSSSAGVDRLLSTGSPSATAHRISTVPQTVADLVRTLNETAGVGTATNRSTDAKSSDQFWSDIGQQLQDGTAIGFDPDEVRRSR